jgi:hypothetical protein
MISLPSKVNNYLWLKEEKIKAENCEQNQRYKDMTVVTPKKVSLSFLNHKSRCHSDAAGEPLVGRGNR